jgi:hypothetical protein
LTALPAAAQSQPGAAGVVAAASAPGKAALGAVVTASAAVTAIDHFFAGASMPIAMASGTSRAPSRRP